MAPTLQAVYSRPVIALGATFGTQDPMGGQVGNHYDCPRALAQCTQTLLLPRGPLRSAPKPCCWPSASG